MVAELRRLAETNDSVRILCVFQASVDAGEEFFAKRWPEVTAIADPELDLYTAFGLGRGSFSQFVGPRVIGRAFAALIKGNFIGKPVGDPLVMPGLFLIRNHTVLRAQSFRDVSDHPDFEQFVELPTATRPDRSE